MIISVLQMKKLKGTEIMPFYLGIVILHPCLEMPCTFGGLRKRTRLWISTDLGVTPSIMYQPTVPV